MTWIELTLGAMFVLALAVAAGEMHDANDAGEVQLSLICAVLALGFLGLLLK